MNGKEKTEPPIWAKIFSFLLIIGAAAWVWSEIPSWPEPSPPVPIAEADLSNNAFIMCKRHLKAALTSPSTADFPFLDFQSVKISGQQYLVQSYVDSQNGLGAMVRTNWTCTIEHDGVSSQNEQSAWTLIDLAER